MSLWDTAVDFFSGGGRSDINEGYDKANSYLNPYRTMGFNNTKAFENNANQLNQFLSPYAGAGSWMYNQINQSPNDFYNKLMSGYSESPEAKYAQEQAMRAATQGASASGMLGSGAFQKGIMQNANDISQRDRQQYFNNIMGANQAQMGYLGNLQGQQDIYRQMLQYLSNLGYGAAGTMGQNEIGRGTAQAGLGRQTVGDIMSLLGFGGGGGLFGSGGGQGGQGGQGGSQGVNLSPAQLAQIAAMFA